VRKQAARRLRCLSPAAFLPSFGARWHADVHRISALRAAEELLTQLEQWQADGRPPARALVRTAALLLAKTAGVALCTPLSPGRGTSQAPQKNQQGQRPAVLGKDLDWFRWPRLVLANRPLPTALYFVASAPLAWDFQLAVDLPFLARHVRGPLRFDPNPFAHGGPPSSIRGGRGSPPVHNERSG